MKPDASGKNAAVERFLLAETAGLRAYLHMLLGNLHDAEDVLQDAFIKYLRNGPSPSEQARRWLFTVCRNTAINLQQGNRRRKTREQIRPDGVSRCADPATQVQERDSLDRVSACLSRLSEDVREMVYLKFAEDLSLSEIAERTGVPRSTVALRVQQGLALLGRYFGDNP